eukprot:839650-Prorocentrum_minimum.AAC.1
MVSLTWGWFGGGMLVQEHSYAALFRGARHCEPPGARPEVSRVLRGGGGDVASGGTHRAR